MLQSTLSKLVIPSGKPLKYRWPHTYLVEGKLPGNEKLAVGIDPGVNFGLTVINMDYVQVIWGSLPRQEKKGMHGADAYQYVLQYFTMLEGHDVSTCRAVVEGAAYHSQFGQVGLEEVRFGFFLSLYHLSFDVSIVPPATIRLGASGSGKTQAMDIWPQLKHDACDSIFCALYALGLDG
jgi:hypothetical protein